MADIDDSRWYEAFTSTGYRFMRVSRETGKEIERIGVVSGGTITRNDSTSIKESAEMTLVGSYDFGPDLLRIYAEFGWMDGTTADVCLGTFLPVTPSRSVKAGYSTASLKLYGRLQELLDDKFAKPYTVAPGSNAVLVAKSVVESMGFECIAEESDYTTTQTRYYGVGAETDQVDESDDSDSSSTKDTKLGMVNDLLDLAGFRAAFTDPYGRVILQKYVDASNKPVAWEFIEGANAKFCAEMEEERDYTDTANHVVVRYGSSTGDVVIGEAWDNDPNSDLSTVSRGRTITTSYTYNELPEVSEDQTQQEYADARAATLLKTAQAIVRRFTFIHTYAPVALSDVVKLEYPSAGIDETPQVRTQTITLSAGCPVECEARKFNRRSS